MGAPFCSGILAAGAAKGATYNYAAASESVLTKVGRIQAACERHEVPLTAAALQFPLGHRSVASVIPGVYTVEQVKENVRLMGIEIPSQLWDELKAAGLLHKDAPNPRDH